MCYTCAVLNFSSNQHGELMIRTEVLALLTKHRERLRSLGVNHAAVFGSVATGENRADSDVDILVELIPARRTVFDLVGIENAVTDLIACDVHVAIEDQLKPALRSSVLVNAVYAF